MNLILFDDFSRSHLLPLTFTRPVAELRIGILTIREKWEFFAKTTCSFITEEYLQAKYPIVKGNDNLLIAGSVLPDRSFYDAVLWLGKGEALTKEGELIAAYDADGHCALTKDKYTCREYDKPLLRIKQLWDIFSLNAYALEADFEELTKGRKSAELSSDNTIIGNRYFLEEGAQISCSIINTSTGPVYLGANAQIWEGCMVRGGLAMGEGSVLKMGAKIYGATTIGPESRIGGEVSNCVIQGFSNKGHDGFLGNSVLGEWCNLGADTNNSNLKNNYSEVELFDYAENRPVGTGLQFCGLIMGDHSKSGINTMFNTGTVAGVCANIFGSGFPPKMIPSFAWGGFDQTTCHLGKAIETAKKVFQRRGISFDETEEAILRHIYRLTFPD